MKVKCVRLRDGRESAGDSDGWLQVGQQYDVLAIETNLLASMPSMRTSFRVSEPRDGIPGLWATSLFEVVDGVVPQGWTAKVEEDGNLTLAPSAWQAEDFWARLADGEQGAQQEYREGLDQLSV
jgi:hypothetical protein